MNGNFARTDQQLRYLTYTAKITSGEYIQVLPYNPNRRAIWIYDQILPLGVNNLLLWLRDGPLSLTALPSDWNATNGVYIPGGADNFYSQLVSIPPIGPITLGRLTGGAAENNTIILEGFA